MTHKFKSIDYKIKCPNYEKYLDSCPGSKIRLTDEEFSIITGKCVTEDFKTCAVYKKLSKEKAA